MAAHRRKQLQGGRRRIEDEGEDEAPIDVNDVENDSLSEGSVVTDEDDAEASDISEDETTPSKPNSDTPSKANGHVKTAAKSTSKSTDKASRQPDLTDTDLMRNGSLNASSGQKLSETELVQAAEGLSFDDLVDETAVSTVPVEPKSLTSTKQDTPLDRRRREHEDYKKTRDENPAFVPNRGAFFMHDHRQAGPAANGFRPFGRGRGGRPQVGGPFSPANIRAQATEASNAPWSHDLHDSTQIPQSQKSATQYSSSYPVPTKTNAAPAAPNRSFSKTVHVANVPVRVLFEGMKEPIVFSKVPVKQHTRLPHHRPPLRRDKPVRISLPNNAPRYISPSVERSFIFIPRAMRPNQQGSGRGRGRGYQGVGGYSSRRTSAYGGSVYTPSVAMSRRSSLAHDISRDILASPAGSTLSRTAYTSEVAKPVVRLPPAFMPPAAVVNLPPAQAYPRPEDPAQREHHAHLTMHQPIPQKTVSVADIESPANLPINLPQQQHQQPFHQQVPAQMNGMPYGADGQYPHTRNMSYPSQGSTGTPLSQIPERAIHAQPFQPPPFQAYYPQLYNPMAAPPQGFYYAPSMPAQQQPYGPVMAPANGSTAFVPQPGPYVMPSQTEGQAAPSTGNSHPGSQQPTNQGGTIAQESNGMVYYYDSSSIYNGPSAAAPSGAAYPMGQPGGVVGMGGMMTPSPDGYYYPQTQPPQGTVFYG